MKKTRWTIMVMVLAFLLLPMGKAEAGTKAGAGGYKLSVSQQYWQPKIFRYLPFYQIFQNGGSRV